MNGIVHHGKQSILWSVGIKATQIKNFNLFSFQLGPKIAKVFIGLFDNGMDDSKLHIVGHSLGAHLAAQIGRTITEKSDGRIKLQRYIYSVKR